MVIFAALNARPNCLTGAVALAQLERLDENLARRDEIVQRYFKELAGLPHLRLPNIHKDATCAWWPLPVLYTGEKPTRDELAEALQAEGVGLTTALSPGRGNLHTPVIKDRHYYGRTDKVPHFLESVRYDEWSCPVADEVGRQVLRLPVDQRYTDDDVSDTIAGIRKVWSHYFETSTVG